MKRLFVTVLVLLSTTIVALAWTHGAPLRSSGSSGSIAYPTQVPWILGSNTKPIQGGTTTGGNETLTFAVGLYPHGETIVIAGASPSTLNGTFVVTASTAGNVTYACGSHCAAWTSGGTISDGPNPSALTTMLGQGKIANMGVIQGGTSAADWNSITGTGYQLMQGIGNYAIYCAQLGMDTAQCTTNGPSYISGLIDSLVADGATWIFVNEPCFTSTDLGDQVTGYIVGTTLTVVSGTFPFSIAAPDGIVGSGATGSIVSGSGGVGTYTLDTSQTVGSSGSPVSMSIFGKSTSNTDECSIPLNVASTNWLVNYIHTNHPGVKFGYSAAENDGPSDFITLLNNGASLDFVQNESYENITDDGNLWSAFHAAYPSVVTSFNIESLRTFCAESGFSYSSSSVDMLSWWDIDNYGPWGYPVMEPGNLAAAVDYATTKNKGDTCNQTNSYDKTPQWQPIWNGATGVNGATRTIIDNVHYAGTGWANTYTMGTCDYRIFSGLNAQYGIVEYNGQTFIPPGVTQTNPSAPGWDTRTCNAAMPAITVGASGECRDEVQDPFVGYLTQGVASVAVATGGSGYASAPTVSFTGGTAVTAATATAHLSGGVVTSITISNNGDYSSPPTGATLSGGSPTTAATLGTPVITGVVHVNSGTFNQSIMTYLTGIIGTGVTAGTYLQAGAASGAGGGGTGAYLVTQAQNVGSAASPVSLSANLGHFACLVEVRNHNSSPAGVGVTSYFQFSIFY